MPIIEVKNNHIKPGLPQSIYVICKNCDSIIELPITNIAHEENISYPKGDQSSQTEHFHSLVFSNIFSYTCENCHSLEHISTFYLEYKGIAYDMFGPVYSSPEDLIPILPNGLEMLYMQQRRELEYNLEKNQRIPEYRQQTVKQEMARKRARQLEEFDRIHCEQMGRERFTAAKQRYEEEKGNDILSQLLGQKTKKR